MRSEDMSQNYFVLNKPKKYMRSKDYNASMRQLNNLQKQVKLEADNVIRGANDINDMTLNKKTHYHDYKKVLPEYQYLDHVRFLNDRILKAEEEKTRMECTAELVEGMYRRYLPSTIGRRNQIVDADKQDAYLNLQIDECLDRARDILLTNRTDISIM